MMPENFLNLNYWYFITFIYLFVGFLFSRGVIGSVTRLMSIVGWPIELAQRLSGTKSLPYLFLLEWFLFHPAMRYGGYVLIALPLIIYTSFMLDKLNIERKKLNSLISIFLIISVLGYLGRNITRLNKEINRLKLLQN